MVVPDGVRGGFWSMDVKLDLELDILERILTFLPGTVKARMAYWRSWESSAREFQPYFHFNRF